ncbi:hypothetical protein TNIN_305441 [Trichonephila inaurata madagascariensis]|uniref:Uncharacterized protein n=1 Tax=Trichonephila inaurata madagascariensis TaxID=2747483 RepID=A0A8X6Y888_9ARAC|nr:hypothetical protein TNIN_305441 [Trichonephila inaurata madagascariensis]
MLQGFTHVISQSAGIVEEVSVHFFVVVLNTSIRSTLRSGSVIVANEGSYRGVTIIKLVGKLFHTCPVDVKYRRPRQFLETLKGLKFIYVNDLSNLELSNSRFLTGSGLCTCVISFPRLNKTTPKLE